MRNNYYYRKGGHAAIRKATNDRQKFYASENDKYRKRKTAGRRALLSDKKNFRVVNTKRKNKYKNTYKNTKYYKIDGKMARGIPGLDTTKTTIYEYKYPIIEIFEELETNLEKEIHFMEFLSKNAYFRDDGQEFAPVKDPPKINRNGRNLNKTNMTFTTNIDCVVVQTQMPYYIRPFLAVLGDCYKPTSLGLEEEEADIVCDFIENKAGYDKLQAVAQRYSTVIDKNIRAFYKALLMLLDSKAFNSYFPGVLGRIKLKDKITSNTWDDWLRKLKEDLKQVRVIEPGSLAKIELDYTTDIRWWKPALMDIRFDPRVLIAFVAGYFYRRLTLIANISENGKQLIAMNETDMMFNGYNKNDTYDTVNLVLPFENGNEYYFYTLF